METETTTTTNPTTIWAEYPDDDAITAEESQGGTWADAATAAWIAVAAATSGIVATEVGGDNSDGNYAGTVEIDGGRYVLLVQEGDRVACYEEEA